MSHQVRHAVLNVLNIFLTENREPNKTTHPFNKCNTNLYIITFYYYTLCKYYFYLRM